MTLNTEYKPSIHEGNGVVKQFSYDFNPINKQYLKVSLEINGVWVEQLTGWNATVSDYGGIVTFSLAPSVRVAIERSIPEEQPTSFITSQGFDAKVVETSLDKLTGMVQKVSEAVDRSVKIGIGSGENPDKLIEDIYRADAVSKLAIEASEVAAEKAREAGEKAQEAEEIARSVDPQGIINQCNLYADSKIQLVDVLPTPARDDVLYCIPEGN